MMRHPVSTSVARALSTEFRDVFKCDMICDDARFENNTEQ